MSCSSALWDWTDETTFKRKFHPVLLKCALLLCTKVFVFSVVCVFFFLSQSALAFCGMYSVTSLQRLTWMCILMTAFPTSVAPKKVQKGTKKCPQVIPARSNKGFGIWRKKHSRDIFLILKSTFFTSLATKIQYHLSNVKYIYIIYCTVPIIIFILEDNSKLSILLNDAQRSMQPRCEGDTMINTNKPYSEGEKQNKNKKSIWVI